MWGMVSFCTIVSISIDHGRKIPGEADPLLTCIKPNMTSVASIFFIPTHGGPAPNAPARAAGIERAPRRADLKIRLTLSKNGASLHSAASDVSDAESFGNAFADAWEGVKQSQMARETSIGAVMEHLHDDVIDQLNGAQISSERE